MSTLFFYATTEAQCRRLLANGILRQGYRLNWISISAHPVHHANPVKTFASSCSTATTTVLLGNGFDGFPDYQWN